MKLHELANILLRKAEQDLIVIEKWRTDPNIADEILGFHAQQAAEKVFKAVLAFHELEFPFTHRLADLIDLMRDYHIDLPLELEDLRFLTPFAVEFCYDFYDDDDNEIFDLEKMYILLRKLFAWAKSIID